MEGVRNDERTAAGGSRRPSSGHGETFLAETSLQSFLQTRPFLPWLLVSILGFAVYSSTLHAPFVFDDQWSIVDNPVIRNIDNFVANGTGYRFNPRRFIGYLTIALNYRLGGLDVTGYHIANLAVHIAASLLVYVFCLLTLRTPHMRESPLSPDARLIALIASLLFVSHPVQTQAVTYVTQRFASLATMFYLLSLVSYARARLIQEAERGAVPGRALLFHILAVAAAVSAMKTKEIAFTLPIMTALYEGFFFRGALRRRVLILLPLTLTTVIIPLSLWAQAGTTGSIIPGLVASATGAAEISRGTYLVTQVRVIATYVRLFMLPVKQSLDYDYPIYTSLLAPQVLLSLLLIVTAFSLAVFLFKRSRSLVPGPRSGTNDPALRLISYGIFWFFINLAVESGFVPLADVIAEHRLYLPSAGVFIAVSVVAGFILQRYRGPAAASVIAAVILALAVAAWQRNRIWRDAVTLWRDTVTKAPNKARPHYNLGTVLSERGMPDEAIRELRAALRLAPDDADVLHNLGGAYAAKGLLDEAIGEYRVALRLNPGRAETHNSLGSAFIGKGETGEAIGEFEAAVKLAPGFADAHNNLGAAYGMKGMAGPAIAHLEEAVRLAPENAVYRKNLAGAYEMKGWFEKAEIERREAERLGKKTWRRQ